ncbi:hypothetical protein RV11_GL001840 [Enterococcus phoeniculicola]|jgi:hypothetical protein|uniref:DUF2922 domain-containing protein n=1 Tax=Enterococcus phoeniculicola ATCC BAA-412 TaxID=1158610 RepID=R3TSG8_9ENTE|nr:DUF2922 domain-containing protein [Enterococcus phoeniculicola]EOL44093.1 hypothetical protein UC3_01723 [Enterococcus phoeniculicola ATCC BAA-412]EOT75195.1 hypothetical protein I589_02795 [Enterococcus phoeniculicola ATCC BAA-412]OJG69937.1 hypothetical protein RV11_GL001840 [Enterococcus phoeniculicola]
MKELHLSFLNAVGGKHTFKPSLTKEDWTAEEVREKMEAFKKLTIFEKEGVALFREVSGAKYVETIETELF